MTLSDAFANNLWPRKKPTLANPVTFGPALPVPISRRSPEVPGKPGNHDVSGVQARLTWDDEKVFFNAPQA